MDQVNLRRGYSLLEVVMALFLLAVAALLVFNLFHVALQRSRGTQVQNTARLLVEQRWAELRAWARSGGYTDPASLSAIDGEVSRPSEYPEFELRVSARPYQLVSPSKELERDTPVADLKSIDEAVALVEVTAQWSGSRGSGTLSQTGLLPRAPQVLERIEVNLLGSNPLNRNATLPLEALAIDTDGAPILGASFGWWVASLGGDATITPRSKTSLADLVHRVGYLNGTSEFKDGKCRVGVSTRFGGRVMTDDSTVVDLVP